MNLPLLVEIPAVLMPLVSRNRESFQAAVVAAEGLFAGRTRSHRDLSSTTHTVGAGRAAEPSAREEALPDTSNHQASFPSPSPSLIRYQATYSAGRNNRVSKVATTIPPIIA